MWKEIEKANSWQEEARQAEGVQESSAMNEIPIVKAYNKPMGKWVEDITKTGKIVIKRNGWEFEVLGEEMKLNILLIRKYYTWFVPKINEFGDSIKDDKWNVIKDMYYTPEVDVFNKDNIPLWKQPKWGKREIIGKASKVNFDSYCKTHKINWQINPLFKEVKKNETTGERYVTSYIGNVKYSIYAKDLDSGELYKIIPWGSYGRFNDIADWTFEHLKQEAWNEYKKLHKSKVITSFINTKVWIRSEGWFNFLDWKLDWFVQEDNRDEVTAITDIVSEFNRDRFIWVNFEKPLELLEYTDSLKIETPKETKTKTEEISIEDIPF